MQDVFVETILSGRFSRYKDRLGSGAYKTVFKGYDNENGIEVAWNQIKFERLKATERARLDDEIKILSMIQHANIINFYGHYIDDEKKRLVILTELMTSGTLRQFVSKSRQQTKLKVVKRWCLQILKGLSYLHSQNIIHRDLKCDNIFINGSMGEVKIGDLGLSTVMTRTHAESVIGTPEFMAPEFYDEHYTEKVDTYAFGMCLLEMVTQEYPYSECTNAAQIYKKVTGGRPPAALLRIEDAQVRMFIELCIGSFEDRPSPTELLGNVFFNEGGSNDSEPVRMRAKDTEKGLEIKLQGIVDGPAASSASPTIPAPSVLQSHATTPKSNISAQSSGSISQLGARSTTSLDPGTENEANNAVHQTPVDVRFAVENDPHYHGRFSHPDEQSARSDESHHGTREIKLQLLIGEVNKEVTFPFNVETDTAEDVAAEMATEFNLGCEVGWLTSELQKRVNDIESTATKHQASPPSTGGVTPPGTASKTRHPDRFGEMMHDSPRMSAITVPIDQRHLNKQTEQTVEGQWLVPAISMPKPAMDPACIGDPASSAELMDANGPAEHLQPVATPAAEPMNAEHPAAGHPAAGHPAATGAFSEPHERAAGHPAAASVENVNSEVPAKMVEPGSHGAEVASPDNRESGGVVHSGGPHGGSQHQPETAEDNIMQELDDLDEQIEETNRKIAELNTKVAQLNTLRTQKFTDLKSIRNRKNSQARNAAPAAPMVDEEAVSQAGPPLLALDGEVAAQAPGPQGPPEGEAAAVGGEGGPSGIDVSSQPMQRLVLDNSSAEMVDGGAAADGQPPAKSQQVDAAMAKQLGVFQLKPRATKPTEKEEDPVFRPGL